MNKKLYDDILKLVEKFIFIWETNNKAPHTLWKINSKHNIVLSLESWEKSYCDNFEDECSIYEEFIFSFSNDFKMHYFRVNEEGYRSSQLALNIEEHGIYIKKILDLAIQDCKPQTLKIVNINGKPKLVLDKT